MLRWGIWTHRLFCRIEVTELYATTLILWNLYFYQRTVQFLKIIPQQTVPSTVCPRGFFASNFVDVKSSSEHENISYPFGLTSVNPIFSRVSTVLLLLVHPATNKARIREVKIYLIFMFSFCLNLNFFIMIRATAVIPCRTYSQIRISVGQSIVIC